MACGVMIFRKNLKFEEKNHFIFLHFIYNVECPKSQMKNNHVIQKIWLRFLQALQLRFQRQFLKIRKKTSVFTCTDTFNFFDLDFSEM